MTNGKSKNDEKIKERVDTLRKEEVP